ncbi:MAG: phytanoyl-CoA dioxygenase family protein [Bacteroidia bacterium]
MSNLNRQSEFNKNGFLKMESFFSVDEVKKLVVQLELAQKHLHQKHRLDQKGLIFHPNLYQHSLQVQQFIAQQKIEKLVSEIAGEEVWVRWDQTITKTPNGNPFPWHRDNVYNKLKAKHYQFWIALTPMTQENGALWIMPGSHNINKIKHSKTSNHWQADNVNESKQLLVEAKVGDVVVFSSHLLHKTEKNESQQNRTAFVIEFMRQSDFDPGIKPPYLFINNGKPNMRSKHPKDNWFTKRFSLIKKTKGEHRWV